MIKRLRGTGRNIQGRITVRHRGSGDRVIHIREDIVLDGIFMINKLEGWRMLQVCNPLTNKKYFLKRTLDIIPGRFLKVISKLILQLIDTKYFKGDMVPLHHIKDGEIIWDINGYGCSSGSKVIKMDDNKVKLPSGEIKSFNNKEIVKIGIGNIKPLISNVTAGTNRHKGIRLRVKGERMNSVDHLNGGRTRKGRISKTKWGKIAKL